MDLPEIRDIVAQFLGHSDLASAALVSKDWNTTFTPVLYSALYRHHYKRSSKWGFIANADHICALHLHWDGVHLFSGICTKLESLDIQTSSSWGPQDWSQLSMLVRRNPSIKSITFSHGSEISPKDFLEAVSSSCPDLRELNLVIYELDVVCLRVILDIAVRLENLRISYDILPIPHTEFRVHSSCFPSLREVHLICCNNEDYFPTRIYAEILRKCPQLRYLDWIIVHYQSGPISDISSLFKVYCPLVEQLTLEAILLTDENLSEILDGCHRLATVDLRGSKFGELAFQSLSRHFASLQELCLYQCKGLTSAMVQQIMTSCCGLTVFYATRLDASDILGDMKDVDVEGTGAKAVIDGQPQDWVCTNMEYLEVFICGLEGKPFEWHRKVLQQLAKLSKLTTLNIGQRGGYGMSPNDGLDLRLKAGLDALSSLKQLRSLDFGGLRQKIEGPDVRWMIEAWPRLLNVQGQLHSNIWQDWKMHRFLLERRM